jgi:hypothetical protein
LPILIPAQLQVLSDEKRGLWKFSSWDFVEWNIFESRIKELAEFVLNPIRWILGMKGLYAAAATHPLDLFLAEISKPLTCEIC